MTREVAQAGELQSEDTSNADGPVGVVDSGVDEPGEAPNQDIPLADSAASEYDDTPEPQVDGDGAEASSSVADREDEPSDAEIIERLRAELEEARNEADESVDKLQRTAAEFQNARRRQERMLSDSIDRANADLIRRMLPILDDLDLAFQNAPISRTGDAENAKVETDPQQENEEAWIAGFRQIQKKLLNLLEEEGVTPIDASGAFDPQRHEAVLSEESDEIESGHIIGVLRSGYEFKGQVLRPAMVRVAA